MIEHIVFCQKDVVFADLGLMITRNSDLVNKHKGTLKELEKQVDVLTLTAINPSYPPYVYAGNQRFVCY